MFKGHKIIAIIPARGGSKGVPRKNIRSLLGKPLIGYSIEQARSVKWIDRIVVTTDDPAIQNIARRFGADVPFLRPKSLSKDTSLMLPTVLHALDYIEDTEENQYDILVLLDPSNPIRSDSDIQSCIQLLLKDNRTDAVVTGVLSRRNPYFNLLEEKRGGYVAPSKDSGRTIHRRQDTPKTYDMNASIYVIRISTLRRTQTFLPRKTRLYLMPEDTAFDIDRPIDFDIVEYLMRKRLKR